MTSPNNYGMTTQITLSSTISLRLLHYTVAHNISSREAIAEILDKALPPLQVMPIRATPLRPAKQVQRLDPEAPTMNVGVLSSIQNPLESASLIGSLDTVFQLAMLKARAHPVGTLFLIRHLFTAEAWASMNRTIKTSLARRFAILAKSEFQPDSVKGNLRGIALHSMTKSGHVYCISDRP